MGNLITPPTRLVAMTSASATLGTVTDVGHRRKLVHDVGGLVVVDHPLAAPYRLLDIGEVDADVVALNASAWGGPPIGALVFRDPAQIDTFAPVSTNPYATGPDRLELAATSTAAAGAWSPASSTLANLDDAATGTRREKAPPRAASAGAYLSHLLDYMMVSARSLPLVMVIGRPEQHIPGGHVRRQRCACGAGGAATGRQRDLAICNADHAFSI